MESKSQASALTVSFANWTDFSTPLTYAVLVDEVAVSAQGGSSSRIITAPATLGAHTLKGRIYDSLNNVSEVLLGFTVNTPQESWRQSYFGSVANSGNRADTFDFDLDGLANLVEYAFGLNPTQAASMQLPQPQRIGGDSVISFTQPAGVSGITYRCQWSPNLAPGSWQEVTDTGSGSTHTFSVPFGNNTKIFMRFRITSP